jgi:hypothetical protein
VLCANIAHSTTAQRAARRIEENMFIFLERPRKTCKTEGEARGYPSAPPKYFDAIIWCDCAYKNL